MVILTINTQWLKWLIYSIASLTTVSRVSFWAPQILTNYYHTTSRYYSSQFNNKIVIQSNLLCSRDFGTSTFPRRFTITIDSLHLYNYTIDGLNFTVIIVSVVERPGSRIASPLTDVTSWHCKRTVHSLFLTTTVHNSIALLLQASNAYIFQLLIQQDKTQYYNK